MNPKRSASAALNSRPTSLRSFVTALAAVISLVLLAVEGRAQGKGKPTYQYESGDIRVSIPTADEPRVKTFGAGSLKRAAKYLEDGAVSWVREKSCVNWSPHRSVTRR